MEKLLLNNGIVSVGDVFFSSWRYDFYQVIAVHGKKTITIRQISSERKVSNQHSFFKAPIINRFTGEPVKRQINTESLIPVIRLDENEVAWQVKEGRSHYIKI